MSLRRRTFLAAIPAAALAGCAGERPLQVAVVWSGEELRRFNEVVDEYGSVNVYSAGDNIGALLRGPAREVLPDVAVIPRLGLLFDPSIQSRIRPLAEAGSRQPAFWRGLVTPYGSDERLGAWFKIAHKSLVWHRAGEGTPPADLDGWQPGRLAIGAADGWVLSDWFENVLLAYAPEVYGGLFPPLDSADWWRAPQVASALKLLGTVWRSAFTPEQGRRALTMQFHDSILDVFVYRTADFVAAPDFALPVIERHAGKGAAAYFRFPAYRQNPPPLVVGGDVAVAMKDGGEKAVDFVNWLTRERKKPDALTRWVADGGFLTPFTLPPHELLREPAQELKSAANAHYDLSDRLLGGLEGGDGRGLWRVLTELFTDVTVNTVEPDTAARAAQDKLYAGSREGAL
ncbi:hypothetical protein [Nonomuraea sp. NPDC050786]|uniref:hypothetical protein n=1 Tax=Nonomuraea sp. NPDC050786 TaxID=3154840 RepID=UPI0033CE35DE